MAQDPAIRATSELFAKVLETPAARSLVNRAENGGVLPGGGISAPAQPFLAALLSLRFPRRPIVVVADQLKAQELFQQDILTWLQALGGETGHVSGAADQARDLRAGAETPLAAPSSNDPVGRRVLFFPSWEILPQESRLPHVDVIGERLETLAALTWHQPGVAKAGPPLIVASVAALLQRTFPRQSFESQTRVLVRGERVDPLDLVEWLEARGYEPEAQVSQKGELALRGGILDVYPLTSPFPARLEFFGDELESLRFFDPLTQISREEIGSITLPPAGELGLLKRLRNAPGPGVSTEPPLERLGTLLDYLPPESILICCEPEQLEAMAREYEGQVRGDDPFFVSWRSFRSDAAAKGITLLDARESEPDASSQELRAPGTAGAQEAARPSANPVSPESETNPAEQVIPTIPVADLRSLEAFRPLPERAARAGGGPGPTPRVLRANPSLAAAGLLRPRLLQQ